MTRKSSVSLLLTAGGAGLALPLFAAGGAQAAQPAATPLAARSVTCTVVPGDTLTRIADRHDIKGGWRALYKKNRKAVGDDPHLIKPGLKLSLKGVAHQRADDKDGEKAAGQKAADKPAGTAGGQAAPPAPPQQSATGFTAPVDGPATTGYRVAGAIWSSGYHTGADFTAPAGAPVVSITSGQVVAAGWGGSSYGNEVVILHPDGHYSQYAHLSSVSVSAGQTVAAGDRIGLVGTTGNSTDPHLHFEVRTGPEYGSDVDPLAYLRAHGVTV